MMIALSFARGWHWYRQWDSNVVGSRIILGLPSASVDVGGVSAIVIIVVSGLHNSLRRGCGSIGIVGEIALSSVG